MDIRGFSGGLLLNWSDREIRSSCAVRRGPMTTATLCLFPVAQKKSLVTVAILSAFIVLWGLSLRGEAGLFPFALLALYLLRQPRSGPIFFMRETPQAA